MEENLILVHEGLTLQDALKKVREDTIFWIMEVHERVSRGKGGGDYDASRSRSRGKHGKGKDGKWDRSKRKSWDAALAKGKAKGKSKWYAAQSWVQAPQTAAAATSAPSTSPQKGKTWAKMDPKGKEYCKKHMVY